MSQVKEADLTANTTMSTSQDFARVVISGDSRKMTPTNFASVLEDPLVALGFLTSTTIGAGIANKHVVTNVTAAAHTLLITEDVILADVTGNSVTVNLVAAADAWDSANSKGQVFMVKKTNIVSSNVVTLDASGAETIDGNATHELASGGQAVVSIISDGSNWHIIGN